MFGYLDHNATSPMAPEVAEAVLPFLPAPSGNPSSLHSFGRMARSALETARARVADLLHRDPADVLFTSGGTGGAQENRRRGGTENVAGIVGLGKAAEIARLEIDQRRYHLSQLRDVFEARLASIPGTILFGQEAPRLPNTTYFALPYYHGETLLMELDRAGFALSSGSACHSMVTEPGQVPKAMSIDSKLALNVIRVSFATSNSLQDVEALVANLRDLVNKLPAVMRRAAV